MGRQVAVVFYVVAMAAVIVGIDLMFFRNRFWERLTVNITKRGTLLRSWDTTLNSSRTDGTRAAPMGMCCFLAFRSSMRGTTTFPYVAANAAAVSGQTSV